MKKQKIHHGTSHDMRLCGNVTSLHEAIRNSWLAGVPIQSFGDIANNLKRVMYSLKSWSYEKFGDVNKE
jgi:hypothetical protein